MVWKQAAMLYYIALAFSLWMFVDALRRRAEFYWFPIIILLGPFGSIAYFALVKLRDWDGSGKTPSRISKTHISDPKTKLALADRSEKGGAWQEALEVYEEVLLREPDNKVALHGRARCNMSAGKFQAATEDLDKLLREDNTFRDYSAALDYAEALYQNGQSDEVIELMEALVSVSGRLNHKVALAHYLNEDGKTAEAREVVKSALKDHVSAEAQVQRRDAQWVARAEQLLAKLVR